MTASTRGDGALRRRPQISGRPVDIGRLLQFHHRELPRQEWLAREQFQRPPVEEARRDEQGLAQRDRLWLAVGLVTLALVFLPDLVLFLPNLLFG